MQYERVEGQIEPELRFYRFVMYAAGFISWLGLGLGFLCVGSFVHIPGCYTFSLLGSQNSRDVLLCPHPRCPSHAHPTLPKVLAVWVLHRIATPPFPTRMEGENLYGEVVPDASRSPTFSWQSWEGKGKRVGLEIPRSVFSGPLT